MQSNGSNKWPYIIAGSVIGGAAGYLLFTDSGRKFRHAVSHPDELANNLDGVRTVIEKKARIVTGKVHAVIQKAKRGIEEGERAYRDAEQHYRSKTSVHSTVDKVNQTAVTIEETVLAPICEMGALVRGIQRGIRALFGRTGPTAVPHDTVIGY